MNATAPVLLIEGRWTVVNPGLVQMSFTVPSDPPSPVRIACAAATLRSHR